MRREWKPGDVASAVVLSRGTVRRVIVRQVNPRYPWIVLDELGGHVSEDVISDPRPLVVIDPEDREAVERLAVETWHRGGNDFTTEPRPSQERIIAIWQAALREFADPKPPKPEEPTGLGAVVEDAGGTLWTRVEHKANISGTVWVSAFSTTLPERAHTREYGDIDAVRVLSEGVQA